MYRIKDFLYMDVYSTSGKRFGFIKDIVIDINSKLIKGFKISSNKIFNKNEIVLSQNIISFSNNMVIKTVSDGNYISFSDIKNTDVVDINGNTVGMISDIIFEMNNFNIKGIIISTGLIKDIALGKKILIPEATILGEDTLLYIIDKKNIEFVSSAHKLCWEDEESNEK